MKSRSLFKLAVLASCLAARPVLAGGYGTINTRALPYYGSFTYSSGLTVVGAGTLTLASATTSLGASGTITVNGAYNVNNVGALSGPATLNAGTLVTGTQVTIPSGVTILNGGALRFPSGGTNIALPGSVNVPLITTSSTLHTSGPMGPFPPGSQIAGSITYSTGVVNVANHITSVNTGGLNDSGSSFLFPPSSAWSTTSGLMKAGTGALVLQGTSSYTGTTTIVPGMIVPGSLTGSAAITIASLADPALSSGAFTTNAIVSQGMLAPASTSGVILTAVPEPSGIFLAGLSLAALLHARRIFGRKS